MHKVFGIAISIREDSRHPADGVHEYLTLMRSHYPFLRPVSLFAAVAGFLLLCPELFAQPKVEKPEEKPPAPILEPMALEKIRPVDAGRIETIHAVPGEFVEAGTLVVTLDHFRQKHLLEVAKIRAQDQSRLRETAADIEIKSSLLDELRQRVRRRLATEEQVRQAEAQVESSRAKQEAARSAQQLTELDRDMAQLNYDNRFLRASRAGVVLTVEKEVGESVAAGVVILTIADTSEWKTQLPVPADLIGALRVGMLIPFTAADGTQGVASVSQLLPDGLVELILPNNDPHSTNPPAPPEFRFSESSQSESMEESPFHSHPIRRGHEGSSL